MEIWVEDWRKTEDRDWRYSGYGTCYTWPIQVQFPVPYMVPQATPGVRPENYGCVPSKKKNRTQTKCHVIYLSTSYIHSSSSASLYHTFFPPSIIQTCLLGLILKPFSLHSSSTLSPFSNTSLSPFLPHSLFMFSFPHPLPFCFRQYLHYFSLYCFPQTFGIWSLNNPFQVILLFVFQLLLSETLTNTADKKEMARLKLILSHLNRSDNWCLGYECEYPGRQWKTV